MTNSTSNCIDGNGDNEGGSDNGGAIHHYTNVMHLFCNSQPVYTFSPLAELKMVVISKVYNPTSKLCTVEDLEILSMSPTEDATDAREDYARMARLVLYPFHKLDNLS